MKIMLSEYLFNHTQVGIPQRNLFASFLRIPERTLSGLRLKRVNYALRECLNIQRVDTMKKFVCIVVCVLFSLPATTFGAYFTIVSEDVEINEELKLGKYETLIQAGSNELNRFTMHRVVKLGDDNRPLDPGQLKGALILLPGGNTNFDMFMLPEDGTSLPTYLALRNIDVYGYSPRTKGLAAGVCETIDCSPAENWGFKTQLRDINYIKWKTMLLHWKRPVIGGFSLGSWLSIAAIDKSPFSYAGAILFEGSLYYDDPALQSQFTEACEDLKMAVQMGQYFDDSIAGLKQIYALAVNFPDEPSPISPIPGLTNRQFALLLLTTPQDPPEGDAPGYTLARGDIVNGLYYIDETSLTEFVTRTNDLEAMAILRDAWCSYAGDQTFVNELHYFYNPILAMGAGHGVGNYMQDTLDLFPSSADISKVEQPEYAHLDYALSQNTVADLDEPIYAWLEEKIFPIWNRRCLTSTNSRSTLQALDIDELANDDAAFFSQLFKHETGGPPEPGVAVPEPGTMLLVGVGILSLIGMRCIRKRRR